MSRTLSMFLVSSLESTLMVRTSREEAVLSNRNFDPQTRTLRKRQADAEMDDTIEHNVQGLTEQIIAEDEAKRAQDLVKKR
jgi:coiled-coil domain-containing protein 12